MVNFSIAIFSFSVMSDRDEPYKMPSGQEAMKFVDGLMIHSGDPVNDYVDMACRHVLLRQGVLGIKVCYIMFVENLLKSIVLARIALVTVK